MLKRQVNSEYSVQASKTPTMSLHALADRSLLGNIFFCVPVCKCIVCDNVFLSRKALITVTLNIILKVMDVKYVR